MELILPPSLPPRSPLYRLAPESLGTRGSESLYSWFLRLAGRHCVKPNHLIRHIGETQLDGGASALMWSRHLHDGNWSFAGVQTQAWVTVLEKMTAREDLRPLTLLPYAEVLPVLGRGQMRRRWCPHCLNERKAEGEAYTSLLWEIGLATVCPEHGTTLMETCPHCGAGATKRSGRNLAYHAPGYCSQCGGWLGDAKTAPADEEAILKATLIGDWIAAMPGLPRDAKLSMAPMLQAAAACYANGQPAVLAKALHVPKTTLHGWLHGSSAPSLSHACHVAARLGIGLADLYLGNAQALPERLPLDLASVLTVSKRSRRKIDWPEVDTQLLAYLRRGEPVSVQRIARELGIAKRTLYSHDVDLMKRLAEKYEAAERKRREGIHHERLESLRKLMEEHGDEDSILLPGQMRKIFEAEGHSVSWWRFEELYGNVSGAATAPC